MRRTLLWFAAVFSLASSAAAQEKKDPVTLRVVKYDGLRDEVAKYRGKVVLVDFWGEYCALCKRRFPHLLELNRNHAADGLVVITVAVDSLDDNPDETREKVHDFLKKQGAHFTNLLIDEPAEVWSKKLRVDAVPAVYVFARDGKWTLFSSRELEDDPQRLDRFLGIVLDEKVK